MTSKENCSIHWTYKPDLNPDDDLMQGDILEPTQSLTAILGKYHPYFVNPDEFPRYMVMTQSCDLVARKKEGMKAKYITLCVVKNVEEAINKMINEDRKEEYSQKICKKSEESKALGFISRLLNNNVQGYFYLHETIDGRIPNPMCAFLPVSFALKTEHYEICKSARILGLCEEFRAKLGWLIGDVFSRAATRDWIQPDSSQVEIEYFKQLRTNLMKVGRYWLEGQQLKALILADKKKEIDCDDVEAVEKFLEENPNPPEKATKKDEALHIVDIILGTHESIDQEVRERVISTLENNQEFSKCFKL